jgi:peroxiredoxin
VGVAVLAFVFLGLAVFAGAWWVIGVAARQREPAAAAAPPPLKGPPQSLPRSQEPPLSEPRKDGNAEEDKAPQQPRREPRFANGEPWVGLGKGNRAPDIDGEDLDGKPFRLSDYRGKVVLVDFWVDWCVYCRQMYEHEKALVKRLADKPFALVGVNGDPSKADAKLAVQKHGLTWRSFWDGGPTGMLIHEQWAINGYPRIVILDAKGIIRYNADGMPRDLKVLDKVIDSLLDEMAKGQPDTSPGAVKETPPVEPIDKPAPKSPKAKEE